MSDESLRVILCWHLHQPDYRDPVSGEFQAPWTYLHGIKDLTDMAAHLENAPPGTRAVVNFSPILLEQLADQASRLRENHDPGEALLRVLGAAEMPREQRDRRSILNRCLQAHPKHMIQRFPPFERLVKLTQLALEVDGGVAYLSDQHLSDIVTWFHLAWFGETVRRQDLRVRSLLERGTDFTVVHRRQLLEVVSDLLGTVLDRYRRLVEQGRIEASVSPYSHPILPLLLDFGTAHESDPGAPLPEADAYPGGMERARWQLIQAQRVFEQFMGLPAKGCWPSEGALSAAALGEIGAAGFSWTASGQGVLRQSLDEAHPDSDHLHRPWRLHPGGPVCFFRDDALSDLIGFTYKDWQGDDAVADLLAHLERIAEQGGPGRVVAIVLDGENPWEHYPDNGVHFVPALYAALAEHPRFRLSTFDECVAAREVPVGTLPRLVAGSWVYGSLGTWIGDPDKNRAWDLLCAAKLSTDDFLGSCDDPELRAAIEAQLAVCEGSDWFWWYGDYNPAAAVAAFDRLYRDQLGRLYGLLGMQPPATLAYPVGRGRGSPELGGTMRPGAA